MYEEGLERAPELAARETHDVLESESGE
jgi:hypothetical protein